MNQRQESGTRYGKRDVPNIEGTGFDCQVLADRLLEEEGVACLAGTCFGKFGDGFLRFSYANSIDNISRALERIERFLTRNNR